MYRADEAETLARKGSDEALLISGVANCVPRRIQAGRQRRIRDDAALPNGTDEIVLADDTFAVADS